MAAANRPHCCSSPDWLHPIAGEIWLDGKVVSTAGRTHAAPRSRGIGMVFQDLALWPHMSVAENIGFGLRARRVAAAECRRRIGDIANLVGLGDYLQSAAGRAFRRTSRAPASRDTWGNAGSGSCYTLLPCAQQSSQPTTCPPRARRAAALDRRHHLQLAEAHMASVGFTPSGPVVAENVRNLQTWTGHQRRASSGRLVSFLILPMR